MSIEHDLEITAKIKSGEACDSHQQARYRCDRLAKEVRRLQAMIKVTEREKCMLCDEPLYTKDQVNTGLCSDECDNLYDAKMEDL